ncbi:MAG: pyridoxal phosphate-dependent aminotransferase [Enterobacterales bacterium]|nr:pyridoxal phosphate-dependent aminotransferase [Enterobacterales bacterium]
MNPIQRSNRLHGICYDIRGPVHEQAQALEASGETILKLNIGNPAPFGYSTSNAILDQIHNNLAASQGYAESAGLESARGAITDYYRRLGFDDIAADQVYLGNGVSELIMIAMQALLNSHDEVLIPSPDYPLWTAAVNLTDAKAVHYQCDEASDWVPDIADIRSKISDKTRAIVLINPNNPTGAVYPRQILEQIVAIAQENDLIIYSDEIYDRILYAEATHIPIATLTDDVLVVTFGGLSKNYCVAGFRVGWMILSGKLSSAADYIQGLQMLLSMRLCANVPMQHAVQVALSEVALPGGDLSEAECLDKHHPNNLTKPESRLTQQMELSYQMINQIPGLSCVKPKGALYLFPKIDIKRFNIKNDEQFVLDFLKQKKVLLVHGGGFNWQQPDHFRIVFLPELQQLQQALNALGDFLLDYRQDS